MVRLIVFVVVVGALVGWIGSWLQRRARRSRLMAKPFPEAWGIIIRKNMPLYNCLPKALREQLHGLVNVFLDEKLFEGCGGQEVDDEIRVTIAAQACVLMLNRPPHHYPNLETVVVYPSTYGIKETHVSGGIAIEDNSTRLGESWGQGTVVLAWDAVRSGACAHTDGQNVTLHEFAHQLDQEDGAADGAPILEDSSAYKGWAEVFLGEYKGLKKSVDHHMRHVMDSYGATNPAEFFAVATETFFEKPKALRRKHPELYAEMKDYYKMDPEAWIEADGDDDEPQRERTEKPRDKSHKRKRNKKKLRRERKRRNRKRKGA